MNIQGVPENDLEKASSYKIFVIFFFKINRQSMFYIKKGVTTIFESINFFPFYLDKASSFYKFSAFFNELKLRLSV